MDKLLIMARVRITSYGDNTNPSAITRITSSH